MLIRWLCNSCDWAELSHYNRPQNSTIWLPAPNIQGHTFKSDSSDQPEPGPTSPSTSLCVFLSESFICAIQRYGPIPPRPCVSLWAPGRILMKSDSELWQSAKERPTEVNKLHTDNVQRGDPPLRFGSPLNLFLEITNWESIARFFQFAVMANHCRLSPPPKSKAVSPCRLTLPVFCD